MVITDHFAWAHLPKAAGTATQRMLEAVPGLVLEADPISSNAKHDTFWQREERIGDRLRVMNLRRLPAWVLSAAHHKAESGLWPDYEPLPMPSVEEMVESTDPDDLLRWMTDGPRLAVGRWLRAEYLAADLVALLAEVGVELGEAELQAIESVPWSGRSYEHDVSASLGHAAIERLYERNPDWAALEGRLYGEIALSSPE